MNNDSYYGRAWNAYHKRFGTNAAQPASVDSSDNIREWEGKRYVVLDNIKGVLAVYHITGAGKLRFLDSPPMEGLAAWGYDPE